MAMVACNNSTNTTQSTEKETSIIIDKGKE